MKIAFIGLGRMGGPMANNLLEAGHSLVVHDLVPRNVEAPTAAGASAGGFGADLMLKDLALATDAARQAGQAVVLGALAQQLYQLWNSRGGGSQDFSAIVNLFRRAA